MFIIYAVVIVVYVDWRIALAIILSSLLVVTGPKITGKIVSDKRRIYQNHAAKYINRITDILNGYKLVNRITRDIFILFTTLNRMNIFTGRV